MLFDGGGGRAEDSIAHLLLPAVARMGFPSSSGCQSSCLCSKSSLLIRAAAKDGWSKTCRCALWPRMQDPSGLRGQGGLRFCSRTPEVLASRTGKDICSKFSRALGNAKPGVEPGPPSPPTDASSLPSRPRIAPPNIKQVGCTPEHREGPTTVIRGSSPQHPQGQGPPDLGPRPRPKERDRSLHHSPIPLSAHRGRLEHVRSDCKRLHCGRRPALGSAPAPWPGSSRGSALRTRAPPRARGLRSPAPPPLLALSRLGAGRGTFSSRPMGRGRWRRTRALGAGVPGGWSGPFPAAEEPGPFSRAPLSPPAASCPAATSSPGTAGPKGLQDEYGTGVGGGEVPSDTGDSAFSPPGGLHPQPPSVWAVW